MTIENLRCFLALADELSFTKAARKTHITQATMSRKINTIESELGIQLLNRSRHSVTLTPIGRELSELIRPILDDYDSAISRVQNLSKGVSDIVRVGIGLYENQLLFPVMQKFLKEDPISQLDLVQFKYRELAEEFNRNHLDMIVSSDQFFDLLTVDDAEKILLHNRPWVLALNRNNPLAENETIDLSSLQSQNIITMNVNSLLTLGNCYRGHFRPSSADYVNSYETKLLLINGDRGVGFLPEFVNVSTYPDIVTRPLMPIYRPRLFYAVYRRSNPNQYAHRLAQILYEYYSPTL